ncbi:MAG: class I SAM-dependent methyltransferase [Planctomycetes bacterium]|nr:class I SAM-dependent methyltransferase [Planctomycetota bacterium]
MKTNRVVSREHAAVMALESRIELERQITDDKAKKIQPLEIGPDWSFDRFRNRSPWRRETFNFLGCFEGKTVLDLGCGYFPTPIYLALAGAKEVWACDVSPNAIAYVRQQAERHGVSDRVHAVVCPAEQMPLEDEMFDLVHGEAVLHHLDLDRAGAEIARVMKPGARAAFKDPLGQNLLLEFARDYLPYRGKNAAKGTDRPLRFPDAETFGRHFSYCRYRGFGLTSMAAVAIYGRHESWLSQALHRVDGAVLRGAPFLHYLCRFIVTLVEK